MVDRILHIGHQLSGEYGKELLQGAAEVYLYKGPAAVVPHLTQHEKLDAAAAERLAQKIAVEMKKVNRQVLLQYSVMLVVFLVLVVAGLFSESYAFAGFFAIPALLALWSMLKFLRRNTL